MNEEKKEGKLMIANQIEPAVYFLNLNNSKINQFSIIYLNLNLAILYTYYNYFYFEMTIKDNTLTQKNDFKVKGPLYKNKPIRKIKTVTYKD